VNSETRVIRPYVGFDRLQREVNGIVLRFGDKRIEAGDGLLVSPEQYLSEHVELVLAEDDGSLVDRVTAISTAIDEAELRLDDVELVAVARTPRLRIEDIVWRCRASGLTEMPLGVPIASPGQRPRALLAPFGGAAIDVFVVLSRELPPAVLKPWRLGTWLARTGFRLSTKLGEVGFTPLPLDAEARERLGLPSGVCRFVHIDDSVIDGAVDEMAVELYVDEEILAQMVQFPSTPASKAFQRQLFLDVMSSIVLHAVRDSAFASLGIDELEGSLVEKVLRVASGRSGERREPEDRDTLTRVLNELRDSPEKFIARIEGRTMSRQDILTSILGN